MNLVFMGKKNKIPIKYFKDQPIYNASNQDNNCYWDVNPHGAYGHRRDIIC